MVTLVTGGNGWVPSHVVRRLARAGETVVSYDVMEPDAYLREFLGKDAEKVIFETGDVTDRARMQELVDKFRETAQNLVPLLAPSLPRLLQPRLANWASHSLC